MIYICGNKISFTYSDGRCVGIEGKNGLSELHCAIDIGYKNDKIHEIEVESLGIRLPEKRDNAENTVQGKADYQYSYNGDKLATIDGRMVFIKDDNGYECELHREYTYDNADRLLTVVQNGEIVRKCHYTDNGLLHSETMQQGTTEFRYNANQQITEAIRKKGEKVVLWKKYEYADNLLLQEFDLHQNGNLTLESYHEHDCDFGNALVIRDMVSRYYYSADGTLIVKIQVLDPKVYQEGYFLNPPAIQNPSINLHKTSDIELYLYNPKMKKGQILFRKNNDLVIAQTLSYDNAGYLKTIYNDSRVGWQGLCFDKLRSLSHADILDCTGNC
jgi:YD repeat-containing protein